MKFCKQCGYQFSSASSRFYCCKSQQPVCITCFRIKCKNCHNSRTIEKTKPKCSKCYMSLNGADLLVQSRCNKFYCARCLCNIFKNAYQKVQIQKNCPANRQIYVKIFCGHQFSYHALAKYFQHFCVECGRTFENILDYQFLDGTKLCFICFPYNQQKYFNCFIKCTCCERLLKNSLEVELMSQDGMILCKNCVEGSKIEENTIQKINNLNIRQAVPPKIQISSNFNQLKQNEKELSSKQHNNKKINQQQEFKPANNKIEFKKFENQSKKVEHNETALFDNFLKKPSIQQLKKKQMQRKQSLKQNNANTSSSFSVTSQFNNEMQDIDDDLTQELGLPHKIKMKKHLSNSTIVSNFKINVPRDNEEDFIKCKICNSFVNRNLSYDLNSTGKKLNETRSTLVEFSVLAESRVSQNNQNIYYSCRACYYQSQIRQNSILSKNNSFSSRSMKNSTGSINRPSILEQSKSSMNYLKVDSLPKRSMCSPSPSPNKQYHLTGSRVSNSKNDSVLSSVPSLVITSQSNLKEVILQSSSSENQTLKKSNVYNQKIIQTNKNQDNLNSKNSNYKNFSTLNQPGYQGQNIKLNSTKNGNINIQNISSEKRECMMCSKSTPTMTLTLTQGFLCQNCYHMRSPHSYQFTTSKIN